MKSKLFAHPWTTDFSHKAYNRYLKSCVDDEVLSPRDQDVARKFYLPESIEYTQLESKKLKVIKYQSSLKKPYTISKGAFENFWEKFRELFIKNKILNYLSFGDIERLMRTCRALNKLDSEVWEYLIERDLRTTFQKEKLFKSPDYAKNLYKSIHFSASYDSILNSKTMYKHRNPKFVSLTHGLSDFKQIKSFETLEKFSGFLFDNFTTTLMLSFLPEQNQIVVWAIDERMGLLNELILKEWDIEETQKIISAKFLNENFIIVQTMKNEEVIEICLFCVDQEDQDHNILIRSTKGIPEVLLQDEITIELKRQNNDLLEFSYCFDERERIFFYNKELVFLYNLKTKKIEFVGLQNERKELISALFSQNSGELFLIDEDLNLSVLTCSYLLKQLNYTEQSRLKIEINKYRSYQNGKTDEAEYLLIVRNMEFYYINLHSKKSRKILSVLEIKGAPYSNEFIQEKSEIIVTNNHLKNWNIYEDVLVVMLNNGDLLVIKLASDGKIVSFAEEKSLLDTFPPITSQFEKPKSYENLVTAQMPPIILINHGYLIIVTFPRIEKSFHVYIFSLSQNVISRDAENWKYYSCGGKHFHRTFWCIMSDDILGHEEDEVKKYFDELSQQKHYSSDRLVKFEDNKLLFKVGLNLFFDLQSSFNKTLSPPKDVRKTYSIENKFITFQIKLPELLKLKKQNDIETEENITEFKRRKNNMPHYIKYPTKNKNWSRKILEIEGVKHLSKNDSDDTQKKKKEEIKDLFSKENKWGIMYTSPFSYLKSKISRKEYFFKKLNQKKDKIKKKYQEERDLMN